MPQEITFRCDMCLEKGFIYIMCKSIEPVVYDILFVHHTFL